jgi:tRNA G46 methylase TrmB
MNGGQLEFRTDHTAYLEDNVFIPEKAIAHYRETLNTAMSEGFDGMSK